MSYHGMEAMKEMCENCPFGNSPKQSHMRNSLMPGRFEEICQSVWSGAAFMCHKTTTHEDGNGEWLPSESDKICAGSLQFLERASANRRQAERRSKLISPASGQKG